MYIFLPENFTPEKDIKGYKALYHEKYCWLIHTIIDVSHRSDVEEGDSVHLSSDLIGYYLGEKLYTTVRKALIDSGIIQWSKGYTVGYSSQLYRLTKKYANRKITLVPFNSARALKYLAKFAAWNQTQRGETPQIPVYQHLLKNLEQIEFDAVGAMKLLSSTNKDLTTNQYNRRLTTIQNFALRRLFFSVPDNTGRFFHSVANLPREYRQFLSYNKKELVNLDIRNSQPLLFVPLIEPYWKSYVEFIDEIYAEKDELDPKFAVTGNGHIAFPEKIFKRTRPTLKFPADIDLYIELTQKGLFYDEFIKYLTEKGIKKLPERNQFKKDFFKRVFFSTGERSITYRYEEWFYKWMPNVSMAVDWYKRDDYKALSIQLQKTEADIIINSICAELLTLKPIPFFLTIHDSILCEPTAAQRISKIMKEKYAKELNLKPTINVEKLK